MTRRDDHDFDPGRDSHSPPRGLAVHRHHARWWRRRSASSSRRSSGCSPALPAGWCSSSAIPSAPCRSATGSSSARPTGAWSRSSTRCPPVELGLGAEPLTARLGLHECLRLPHQSRADRRRASGGSPTSRANSSTPISTRRARTMSGTASSSRMPPGGAIGVVQIAGLVARRILCWTKEGASVAAGAAHRHDPLRLAARRLSAGGSIVAGQPGPARRRRRDRPCLSAGCDAGAAIRGAARMNEDARKGERLSAPSFDPRAERRAERRRDRPRRWVPFVVLLPNLVTLLALCAGLTAIRMAVESRFDLAVGGDHPGGDPRRHRRTAGALSPHDVALRRGARFARRLRRFRRRAGDLPLRLDAGRISDRSAGSARSSSPSAPRSGSPASTRRCRRTSLRPTGSAASSSAYRRRPGPSWRWRPSRSAARSGRSRRNPPRSSRCMSSLRPS